ncbi:isochorismatase family cysteine hydrolase [Kribbella sp. NPDC003505]|uniref:cysteine hydrolase family protein n=1 Tax=Kribbella sp. NPDC003505 TaxID=3154448 RepID=UPI0033B03470
MINLDDSVLAVVDMQYGFVSPASAHVIPLASKFIREWAATGRPYIMTRWYNTPNSLFEQLFNYDIIHKDSHEFEIVDELKDLAAGAVAVLDKPTYSLFSEVGSALVAEHGWRQMIVIGLDTESCVLKTAVDAFEAGLVPLLVTDLTYSHAGEEAHNAGLLVAGRFIGRRQLVQAADVLAANAATTF